MIFNIWRPYKWIKPKKSGWYQCTVEYGYGPNKPSPKVMYLYFRERDSKWINLSRQNVFDGYNVYESCRAPIDNNRVYTDCECERIDVVAWKHLPKYYRWWKYK